MDQQIAVNAITPEVIPMNLVQPNEARVNVTFSGSNGDMPYPVLFDSNDAEIKASVSESIRNGAIPGIRQDPGVNLADYVVDRFEPTEQRPFRLISVRPKTAFGV